MASRIDANTISYLSGTKLAVASLIIGFASLFTFTLMLVGSISGIALGIIALRGVKGNPARGLSKAMAVAGILLSIVAFLPPYFYAAGNANAACTEKRLQSIGAAEARYLEVIGRYGTLEELAKAGLTRLNETLFDDQGAVNGTVVQPPPVAASGLSIDSRTTWSRKRREPS